MAYVAYELHHIRPDVFMGIAGANDPISEGTRSFMIAADKKAIEDGDMPVRIRNFAKKGGGENGK